MIRTAIAFSVLLCSSAAYGQAPATAPPPAPRAAPPPSSYCEKASAGFAQSESAGFAAMGDCGRGDIIILPALANSLVARLCDFTRAIVVTGGMVSCSVVSPPRGRKL